MATWPSGKAEVCKTFITGPTPVVAFFVCPFYLQRYPLTLH
jgi:hypothetical protein